MRKILSTLLLWVLVPLILALSELRRWLEAAKPLNDSKPNDDDKPL
jgi:hypothetical protein